jgi:glycosyltransferase involved in cell wall biosynthesis
MIEATEQKKLTVIIPCFNEERTVLRLLQKVLSQKIVGQVVIIDDGSTDSSLVEIAKISDSRLMLIANERNGGKGNCIWQGIQNANCEYLIIQDADLEYDPLDFNYMVRTLIEKSADAVFGSRFLTSGPRRAVYYWHSLGNAFLTTLSNICTNIYLSDMETCYKLMRTDIAKRLDLKENRFGIEPEITAKLARMNAVIYEVPINYVARTYSEGKKIGWKDGFSAIRCILKYSFFPAGEARVQLGNNTQQKVLESLEGATNYRDWLIGLAAPYYKGKIFELGSGTGNYAQQIITNDSDDLITSFHLSEIDEEALVKLKKMANSNPKVKIHDLKNGIPHDISAESFITWNVLEHIDNDVEALMIANKVCISGSRVFVLVPAMQFAYSKFDLELNHFRRYSKSELIEKARMAGLSNIQVDYVNSFGILSWVLFVKFFNLRPSHGILLRIFDKFVFPVQIFFEKFISLPFGQSLVLRARTK